MIRDLPLTACEAARAQAFPSVALEVDSRAEKSDAFRGEELALEGGVGLADQQASASAYDAVPGNAAA